MKKIPLEKDFQARVSKKLRTLKSTWFFKSSDRVQNGIPDIIMCIGGVFVALGLKRDIKAPATPKQEHTLSLIKDAAGEAFVVHPQNWEKVWEYLLNIAGGTKIG